MIIKQTKSTVLASRVAYDFTQLRNVLERLSQDELCTVDNRDVTVFGATGGALHVRLIEDKTADGKVVYNINIE
jgi:hypothetical protein